MAVQLDQMLVRTENVCGGRLRIEGTRVTVNQIATLYQRGESAEQIAEHFPQAEVGQIYTALAYYHANRDDVDQELAAELSESDQLQAPRNQRS